MGGCWRFVAMGDVSWSGTLPHRCMPAITTHALTPQQTCAAARRALGSAPSGLQSDAPGCMSGRSALLPVSTAPCCCLLPWQGVGLQAASSGAADGGSYPVVAAA